MTSYINSNYMTVSKYVINGLDLLKLRIVNAEGFRNRCMWATPAYNLQQYNFHILFCNQENIYMSPVIWHISQAKDSLMLKTNIITVDQRLEVSRY